ncbi:hypothetical protein HUJ04_004271 [Dendroctonus ponderosae]|nr:hypothetical protein HUJ04_004271 [Dendroctonus ponderosae]
MSRIGDCVNAYQPLMATLPPSRSYIPKNFIKAFGTAAYWLLQAKVTRSGVHIQNCTIKRFLEKPYDS